MRCGRPGGCDSESASPVLWDGDLRGHGRPDLISRVTDAVIDDARARQTRPLAGVYPGAALLGLY